MKNKNERAYGTFLMVSGVMLVSSVFLVKNIAFADASALTSRYEAAFLLIVVGLLIMIIALVVFIKNLLQ